MDLLNGFKSKVKHLPPLLRGTAPALLILALLASLTPVADTLWAEVLTVSGEIETGEFEESPTPTETETPTATPSITPTLPGQAGTSIEVQKIAASRWKDGAVGQTMIVYGRICVWNIGEHFTDGLTIFDQIEIKPHQQNWQILAGANQLIVPTEQIPPGENRCYDYEIEAPYQAETSYRNTVQVTILNHSGWLPGGPHCPGPQPCPYGAQYRVDFEAPVPETETPTPSSEARRGLQPVLPTATLTATPSPSITPSPTLPAGTTPPPNQPPPLQPSPTEPPTATPILTLTEPPAVTPSPSATPLPPSETPPPTETPQPPTDTPPPAATPLPPTATPPPPTDTPPPPPTNTPPVSTPPPGPPPIHDS